MKFSELIAQETPTLIDVYADWCGPCKMMPPILDEVKKSLGDKVNIIKIDIDKNQAFAHQQNIKSVPTLLIYKNNQVVWRQAGVISADQIINVLQQFS